MFKSSFNFNLIYLYAKVFIMSYIILISHIIGRNLCSTFLYLSKYITIFPEAIVENDDKEYQILFASTSTTTITHQFRIYCYLNDIVYLDELMATIDGFK